MEFKPSNLYREAAGPTAAYDIAMSKALLEAVGAGKASSSLRLYRAREALAFSVSDRNRPGFEEAVRFVSDVGIEPVLRLSGGRAVLFHSETLAFSWTTPEANARSEIEERFDLMAGLMVQALGTMGIDARIGEVPNEYCPGKYSINAGGSRKLGGIGQRVVQGAAHIGGLVVISNVSRMRQVLQKVYDVLDYSLDPNSIGCVGDEIGSIEVEEVASLILKHLNTKTSLCDSRFENTLLERAAALEHQYAIDPATLGSMRPGINGTALNLSMIEPLDRSFDGSK